MTLPPFRSESTSPVTLAEDSALGSTVTWPSWLTSRTWLNSTELPLGLPSRSTLITCPGATRYCLPPVAITASMFSISLLVMWSNLASIGWGQPTSRADRNPHEQSSNHIGVPTVKGDG